MAHSRYAEVKVIVLAFLAIAVPFYLTDFVGESNLREWPPLRFLNRDFWYRNFAPGGPRQTRIDEIKIISIQRGKEPGSARGEFRCTHRAFMATLLKKLAQVDPRLIVIDKWYGRIPEGVCTKENDGTTALKNAIHNMPPNVQLVIAEGSYARDQILQYCADVPPEKLGKDEMVLGDLEPLNEGLRDDRVRYGLARINADIRKVPLGWMTYPSDCKVEHVRPILTKTLGTITAEMLDPNIMAGSSLSDLEKRNIHPYTKLGPPGTFQSISAIQLVCNQADEKVDWTHCGPQEGDQATLDGLRHKVLIVGETTGDTHDTDQGVITGPEMQANYIAALLDEGILRPAPLWVTIVATLAWLLFLFWIFYGWLRNQPELAAGVSVMMTFALGVMFTAAITSHWGVYADVVPPTILEIIGLYLGRRIEMTLKPSTDRQPAK